MSADSNFDSIDNSVTLYDVDAANASESLISTLAEVNDDDSF
jgi:hypothetical protein